MFMMTYGNCDISATIRNTLFQLFYAQSAKRMKRTSLDTCISMTSWRNTRKNYAIKINYIIPYWIRDRALQFPQAPLSFCDLIKANRDVTKTSMDNVREQPLLSDCALMLNLLQHKDIQTKSIPIDMNSILLISLLEIPIEFPRNCWSRSLCTSGNLTAPSNSTIILLSSAAIISNYGRGIPG